MAVVTDAHCHLDPELPLERLIEAMDAGGIDRAVLIAAAQQAVGKVGSAGPALFRGCMAIPPLRMPMYRIARRTLQPIPAPDNDAVYAAARAHPDRFLPFVFLNPALGDAAHVELDRGLASGARGVKMHAWFHGFRLSEALPLLQRCAQHGLPVVVHLGFGPAEDVSAALERVPNLKLILAHAGLPHFERLWHTTGVWFDVAAPQLVSRSVVGRLLDAVGDARVLFGSDAPIGIRAAGGHRFTAPPLPDRAMGANLEALLA